MIKKRLMNLRKILKANGFDGYFVPSSDEYLSQYLPHHAKRLEYITDFSGSSGLALILADKVLFFTDGRYLTECQSKLDSSLFEIYDQQFITTFDWQNFIAKDAVLAYDPKLFSSFNLQRFSTLNLKSHSLNLIDEIWTNQPPLPSSKICDYPLQYAGLHYLEKIKKCHDILQHHDATALVISDPASVCWLLNIRAHDVEFSPLLLANIVITDNQTYLLADQSRFEPGLIRENVTLLPAHEILKLIDNIDGLILYDEFQCSAYLSDFIKSKSSKSVNNPCMILKACKNATEIEHIKQGHIQDAVAVCQILSFIATNDMSSHSEYDLGIKLTEFRSRGQKYISDSFPTICGYQENAAIIHYRAKAATAKKIAGNGLLLIDSGGQYLGATTDVTRTVLIGAAKPEYIKLYTKVLKGHIALALSKFPHAKVCGANLDVLARQYLWQEGLDYAHGTGHGVGSFLNVHEGPQNIHLKAFDTPLENGMVLSNEPGYYLSGEFGIRIENLMFVKKSNFAGFLEFEMLTLVPYAKALIDFSMLTNDEYLYLSAYYALIREKIMPLLPDTARLWLSKETQLPTR